MPTRNDWRWTFLEHYAQTRNVTEACHAAHVDPSTAYRHRRKFSNFRQRWADLEEESVDRLEAEARRRALSADDRASHTLLMFLLKAHRPHPYRDKSRALPPPEEEAKPPLPADLLARLSTDELNALESITRKLTGEA
ncbi:MAG: hypothetical protein P4L84_37290 [Isosphaeraceae bacterium]|nr:hypothetical protein [Isosphaeraceae bacterium]